MEIKKQKKKKDPILLNRFHHHGAMDIKATLSVTGGNKRDVGEGLGWIQFVGLDADMSAVPDQTVSSQLLDITSA